MPRSLAPNLLDLFFGLYYYGISRQLNMDAREFCWRISSLSDGNSDL
jgi:hypothetical protein